MLKIASYVELELASPVTRVGFWLASILTGRIAMLMPKATMYEDDFALGFENQVRASWQPFSVEPIPIAHAVN